MGSASAEEKGKKGLVGIHGSGDAKKGKQQYGKGVAGIEKRLKLLCTEANAKRICNDFAMKTVRLSLLNTSSSET